MTQKPPILSAKTIGNLLIITSLIALASIAFPFIRSELEFRFGAKDIAPIDADFVLTIPAINISSPVIKNVDPWDQDLYSQSLRQGVAHAAGSALPGDSGTIFLFAHSSGNPWQQAYTNTPFYRLNKLKQNNIITLKYDGQTYRYTVTHKQVVDPFRTDIFGQNSTDQLILQTCWPIGTDWQRLLIFAVPNNTI
jgi:LPXTG-site transpeptidase (sortase) family protein